MPSRPQPDSVPWLADCGPSKRWPVYTRGNIGEVYPEVVLPLEWDLGGRASELGWRRGAATIGIALPRDIGDEPYVLLGVFGGYAYFNVSLMRLLGVRTPGMAPDLIDAQFLGDADIAPYEPRSGDRNLAATARLVKTAVATLRAKRVPKLAQMRTRVDAHRLAHPGNEAPDAVLWEFLTGALDDLWAYLIESHVINTMQATIAAGALADFCEKHLGDPNLALDLTTGLGDVVSAEPAYAMWRLANETEPAQFDAAFAGFLQTYGHRGPNEFSLNGRDWASYPEVAVTAIDTMRGLDPDRSPKVQARRMAERRAAATKAAKAKLGRRARRLDQAIASAALWSRAREESKDLVIRGNQLGRHSYLELARRAKSRGGVADRTGPMLLTRDEFESYLADPASMIATIDGRRGAYEHLSGLEPPFAFDAAAHRGAAPPLSGWARRGGPTAADRDRDSGSAAAAGFPLVGAAGAPGTATGPARVILDPSDPRGLQPGEILVAPLTDPSWTPLFVAAGAVVVEVGAAMSHSMIVSRELGIPCVVGVPAATAQIVDGALVRVDGSAGTVELL